jgi:NhaP-type Na+/H+ or K+/H+ antiporter
MTVHIALLVAPFAAPLIAELFGASGFLAVLTKLRCEGPVDDTIARRMQTRLDVEELRIVGADDMG